MSRNAALDPLIVNRIAERCKGAAGVLFVTGAGISTESGLPTYRGVGGLYNQGATEEGLPIEEILSGRMITRDPSVCWKYLRRMEKVCRNAQPSYAHKIVAAFERRVPRTWVLTQNVDNLHARAGSTNVIAVHGSLGRLSCMACSYRAEVESYSRLEEVPRCPRCGAAVRPDAVLFGERLPDTAVAAMDRELTQGFDVIFSIGTTSVFPYIRAPLLLGRQRGAMTVEINPGDTAASHLVDHRLRTRAGEALSAIWEKMS